MSEQPIKDSAGLDEPFDDLASPDHPLSVESWASFARSLGLSAPRPRAATPARVFMGNYLSAATGVFLLACLGVFGLNAMVDPLWYLGGNVLAPRNFIFNERLAKTNLLLADGPGSYDCVLFGNSRTILMDVTRMHGYNCFNYSFSGGRVAEYVAFAKYAKHVGLKPRLVIVNADAQNFSDDEVGGGIPDFIAALAPPPSIFRSYLTLDAAALSTRTLLGMSPAPRFYNRRFVGKVMPEFEAYRADEGVINRMIKRTFSSRNAAHYQTLRGVFPDARFVGVVVPISAEIIAERQKRGSLESALDAIYAARGAFDALYDFAAPSVVTADKANFYDDSHFDAEIYDLIVDVLNGRRLDFGLDVGKMSRADYSRAYAMGLQRLRGRKE
jgi:hypothetical protein